LQTRDETNTVAIPYWIRRSPCRSWPWARRTRQQRGCRAFV